MAIDWLIVAEFYSLRVIFFHASNDIGTPTFVPGPPGNFGNAKINLSSFLGRRALAQLSGGLGIH